MSFRCVCITLKGTKCSRKTTNNNKLCFQHTLKCNKKTEKDNIFGSRIR